MIKNLRHQWGISMPNFEVLDAKIASALNKIIHNSHFRRRICLEEQKAQKQDRFPRGKQIAYLICDRWRKIGIFINLIRRISMRWKNWSNLKVHIQYNLAKDFKVKTTLRSAPSPPSPSPETKLILALNIGVNVGVCVWVCVCGCVCCLCVCGCVLNPTPKTQNPWTQDPEPKTLTMNPNLGAGPEAGTNFGTNPFQKNTNNKENNKKKVNENKKKKMKSVPKSKFFPEGCSDLMVSKTNFRNCKLNSIISMIREIFNMLNQCAVDFPTLPVDLCCSQFIQISLEC